jgi:hypothetical protein
MLCNVACPVLTSKILKTPIKVKLLMKCMFSLIARFEVFMAVESQVEVS